MATTDLLVRLVGDTSRLRKDLNKATGTMAKMQKSVGKLGGMLAGAFAVGQITQFAKESLRAYNIQAQAETKLLTALKGRKDIQSDLIKQAQDLQKITLFGDEATIDAQTQLLTMGLTADQVKQLTPLVQDLAATTRKDLGRATKLVTSALATGSTTLEKYGVELSASNSLAENLELTIQGLNDSVGGQAAAAAKSGTGAITQLSNAFGDLQESIGKLIMGGADSGIIGYLTKITVAADDLVKAFDTAKLSQIMLAFGMAASGNLKGAYDAMIAVKDSADEQKKSLENLRSGYDEHNAMLEAAAEKQKKLRQEREKGAAILASQQTALGPVVDTIGDINTAYIAGGEAINAYTDTLDKVAVKTQELTRINRGFFTEFQELGGETFLNLEAVMENFASNVLVGFAEDLGNAASGIGNFGENVLNAVANFMKQLGAQMIQLGVAKSVLDKLSAALPGGFLIAAGVALVAASKLVGNTLNKGIGGGSVSGGGSGTAAATGTGSAFGLGRESQREQTINVKGVIDPRGIRFMLDKDARNEGIRG